MSEPRIGRILVASLHQSIQDLLPNRIEFYENWLRPAGLREGTIGLAPLSAVLSFLRLEGEPYDAITTRAGEYAGDWTMARAAADRTPDRQGAAAAVAGPHGAPGRARSDHRDLSRHAHGREGASGHHHDRHPRLAVLRGARAFELARCAAFTPLAVGRVFSAFGLPAEVQVHAVPGAGDGSRLPAGAAARHAGDGGGARNRLTGAVAPGDENPMLNIAHRVIALACLLLASGAVVRAQTRRG